MIEPEFQYRMVRADGLEVGCCTCDECVPLLGQWAREADDEYPEEAPHRVERREFGPWVPVPEPSEGSDTMTAKDGTP